MYILTNHSHKSLYIGVTNNLAKRICEHKNNMNDGFTKKYKTYFLVYFETHDSVENAINREKKLKNLVRRKKDALITAFNLGWEDLYTKILSVAK